MIQINELRLGNWVIYKLKDNSFLEDYNSDFIYSQITKIETIGNRIDIVGAKYKYNGDSYSPESDKESFLSIPITEEVLLKCGFETTDNWWFKLKIETEDEFYLNVSPKEHFAYFILRNRTVSEIVNLDHLHWLQNAYFFFVGKELDIKL